jgi:pimeloyl-ACP methyl ester carboxylesterase
MKVAEAKQPDPTVDRARQQVALPDGRRLSYSAYGAELGAGPTVLVLDGPGSRGLAAAASSIAGPMGIALISPDRPGFGETTIPERGGIPEWPRDCEVLIDHLGLERVGIITQSGGTPYGLAMAAALPERISAIALLGAVAPTGDAESVAELGSQLRTGVKLARRAPWLLRLALLPMARGARKDPEKIAAKVAADSPPADAAVLEDPRMWRVHVDATAEILVRPSAIAREIGLLARPWGFDLADAKVPAAFWSGELDDVHPTSQSRRIASYLDDPPIRVVQGAANFGLRTVYRDVLRFVVSSPPELPMPAPTERSA